MTKTSVGNILQDAGLCVTITRSNWIKNLPLDLGGLYASDGSTAQQIQSTRQTGSRSGQKRGTFESGKGVESLP